MVKVESEFSALVADGYSRTRATEIVIERSVAAAVATTTVVLVEGLSDQIVVEILAARRGRSLSDEDIAIVAMGGATNIGRFASLFGPRGRNVKLAGLYDVAAEAHVVRGLEHAGLGQNLDRTQLETLGFFACVIDLEDELIRCLGPAKMERLIEIQGELPSLRTMQNEPFHRERTIDQHLHRFIGRGRYRYARVLAEAIDLDDIPPPLDRLLAHVLGLVGPTQL